MPVYHFPNSNLFWENDDEDADLGAYFGTNPWPWFGFCSNGDEKQQYMVTSWRHIEGIVGTVNIPSFIPSHFDGEC